MYAHLAASGIDIGPYTGLATTCFQLIYTGLATPGVLYTGLATPGFLYTGLAAPGFFDKYTGLATPGFDIYRLSSTGVCPYTGLSEQGLDIYRFSNTWVLYIGLIAPELLSIYRFSNTRFHIYIQVQQHQGFKFTGLATPAFYIYTF